MAVTATPIFPQAIRGVITQFTNTDSTTAKSVFAAGSNGSKVENIMVSSSDTTARDLILGIYNGTTNFAIGIVSIPITAGTVDSTFSVDYLRSTQFGGQTYMGFNYDPNGNKYLYLPSGFSLYMNVGVAVTSAKAINIYVQGGDF